MMNRATIGIIASSLHVVTSGGKIAKINCCDSGTVADLPDWNDSIWINEHRTQSLNLSTGTPSGWSIELDAPNGAGGGGSGDGTVGDADFPDAIMSSFWFTGQVNIESTIVCNFHGLDPGKTYNILLMSYNNDQHPDGDIDFTFGGVTHSGDPGQFPFKPSWTNLGPDETGTINGLFSSSVTSVNVVGFIITEN